MLEQQQSYFILIDGRKRIVAKLTDRNSFEYYDDFNTCCVYDDLSDNVEVLAPCDYDELVFFKRKAAEMTGLEIKKVCDEKFELEQKNKRLNEVLFLARDSAYSSSPDCPKCSFIDDMLSKALKLEDDNEN